MLHGVFTLAASTLSVQAALEGQPSLSDLWHTSLAVQGGKGAPAQPPEPLHLSSVVQASESLQDAVVALKG
jgi:hypothetical protein